MSVARRAIDDIALRVLSRGFDEYGFFAKPADFTPTLPCAFFRDAAGDIQHDMDFTQYTGGTALYVNYDTGNDTSGDGSSGTPYKTVQKALIVAEAGGDAAYCVKVTSDTAFPRNTFWRSTQYSFTDKTIAVIPDNTSGRIIAHYGETTRAWVADENVWKSTRSVARSVFDMDDLDDNGLPKPYTGVVDLASCKATSKTWYTDETYVWVNTADGLVPDNAKILVGVGVTNIAVLLGTSKLYLEGITHIGASNNNDPLSIRGDLTGASTVGHFVAKDCNFLGGNLVYAATSAGNAIATAAVESAYFFDCRAAYGRRDGFNLHYSQVTTNDRRGCLGLFYGCESYDNGTADAGTGSDNAFTSHEGASQLIIASEGYNCRGPLLINVNGCYSIAVDCNMRDNVYGGAAYQFTTDTPGGGGDGKAILINCTHDGETLSTTDLNTDAAMAVYLIGSDLTNVGSGSVVTVR